jgi:hypothetical protein
MSKPIATVNIPDTYTYSKVVNVRISGKGTASRINHLC